MRAHAGGPTTGEVDRRMISGSSLATQKVQGQQRAQGLTKADATGMVAQVCNPPIQEAGAGKSEIQGTYGTFGLKSDLMPCVWRSEAKWPLVHSFYHAGPWIYSGSRTMAETFPFAEASQQASCGFERNHISGTAWCLQRQLERNHISRIDPNHILRNVRNQP